MVKSKSDTEQQTSDQDLIHEKHTMTLYIEHEEIKLTLETVSLKNYNT